MTTPRNTPSNLRTIAGIAPPSEPFPSLPSSQVVGHRAEMSRSMVDPEEGTDSGPKSIPPPDAKVDPYIGVTIDGRYKIESVLGEGGMGVVYAGRHKVINKRVAIKVLRGDQSRDKEMTERFLQEAQAASSIGHPHIIDVSDFGTLPDGAAYFVMEFLEGQALSSVLKDVRPVPTERLIRIGRQVADALAAAHDQGIVHRDLKPDNIFLVTRGSEKDYVKILDFGIAKVATSSNTKLTRAGTVFGTPHYMSPEQAAGAPVDHRTDLYALGVILYEMASGQVPFDADNYMGILTQHMYKAPVPIRAIVPPVGEDIPPGLEAIILKLLSKKPEQRYQGMGELVEDLDRLEKGQMPQAVSEMIARSGAFNVPADYFNQHTKADVMHATPRGKGGAKWPLVAGIAGVVVAVGIVVTVMSMGSSSTAQTPPTSSSTPAAATSAPPPPATSAAEPPKPAGKPVMVIAQPIDAEVFQGAENLGKVPVNVQVADGQTVSVEVRREGYVTQTLSLDGTKPRQEIKLVRDAKVKLGKPPPTAVAGPPVGVQPPPPSTGGGNTGGGDVVDPWKKKK